MADFIASYKSNKSTVGQGEAAEVVGKYGLGERNSKGATSIQFCTEENLVITNTLFQLPLWRLSI